MHLDLSLRTPLPDSLPETMREIITKLKKSSCKEECLKKAYGIMTGKYRGYRIKTYTKLFDIFKRDIDYLWKKEGFLHCTNMNYVMRVLLVESGFFKEDDLKLKWTLVWGISPHQYLQANVDGKWIDVDVWANAYGIGFGDHAKGFR